VKLIDAERKYHFAPYTTDSEVFKIELTAEEILNKYTDEGCQEAYAQPTVKPELTDEQSIAHLQSSGWMQRHDKEMYESGLKEQLADDSDSYDSLLPTVQPEIIRKPVIGYEGYYEVDNCGRVYALNRVIHVEDHGRSYDKHLVGGILKQHMHSNGYKIVPLTKDGKTKNVFVHRIVAMAFLANPDKLPCINHKDEDKTNNFVENLEWCTYQYNNAYGSKPKKHSKWMSGRKLSDEHKQHISDGHKRHWDEIRTERRIEE